MIHLLSLLGAALAVAEDTCEAPAVVPVRVASAPAVEWRASVLASQTSRSLETAARGAR